MKWPAGWRNETRNNDRKIWLRVYQHKTGWVVSIARRGHYAHPGLRCELDGHRISHVANGPSLKSLLVWWVTFKLEGKP